MTNTTRDRLIRYTELHDPARPGLLSRFDKVRNLIEIDKMRADCLPSFYQTRLMFTDLPYTKLAADNNNFHAYGEEPEFEKLTPERFGFLHNIVAP